MLALHPADRIIDLKDVVSELGITAVVHLVRRTVPFHARERIISNTHESDFVRIPLAQAV